MNELDEISGAVQWDPDTGLPIIQSDDPQSTSVIASEYDHNIRLRPDHYDNSVDDVVRKFLNTSNKSNAEVTITISMPLIQEGLVALINQYHDVTTADIKSMLTSIIKNDINIDDIADLIVKSYYALE